MTTIKLGRTTRPIGWVKAVRKVYETFPKAVRDRINTALTIAAEGGKADIAKPLKGLEPGVMEIALRYQANAWRVVYVTEIAGKLWVVHVFGKKSKTGIKTPKRDIDLVKARLGRLKRGLLQ